MNPEITKIIEHYLAGELSADDLRSFEERLNTNEALRQEVEKQRSIHEAAKRAYQRQQVKTIGKRYHIKRNFWRGGLSVLIAGLIAAGAFFLMRPDTVQEAPKAPELSDQTRAKMDSLAALDLEAQYFLIPADGGVVLSEKGVLISVPKQAFSLNGKPYDGEVTVQFQEALDAIDIMKSGLNTMSGDQLLETGGMVSVAGFTLDGKPLDFNPEVGVYVQVPSSDDNPEMQLYDGVLKADGTTDWVNPEELEKIPVPVSMSDLDFYPAGYENYLDQLKWKQAKQSRDSLYLSFEDSYGIAQGQPLSGQLLFQNNCASCHHRFKDGTAPALAGVRNRWYRDGDTDEDIIQWVKNYEVAAATSNRGKKAVSIKPTNMNRFEGKLSDAQIRTILYYVDPMGASTAINSEPAIGIRNTQETPFLFVQDEAAMDTIVASDACNYISPSKVLGFWHDKFNNTNLATREFERRMQAIHQTCNDAVLHVYLSRLDEPLHKADAEVAAMGYADFQAFAAEKVGRVDASDKHVQQLTAFYEKAVKRLKKRNDILQKQEQKRRDDFDKSVQKSRTEEVKRRVQREQQAFTEEYAFNLKSVHKQMSKTRGFTIKKASRHRGRSAVKNIDAQVREATASRTTSIINDPASGATAQIIYNDFSFKVADHDNYLKLYAYTMPYEINSYSRIDHKNGTFTYSLNNDMRYNLAVIGVTENGYAYFQKQNFRTDDLDVITLETVSEEKLDASVEQLNRGRNVKPMRITEELDWLAKEHANYKEQRLRKEMATFRREIRKIIFPCCQYEWKLDQLEEDISRPE